MKFHKNKNKKRTRKSNRTSIVKTLKYPAHVKYDNIGTITYIKVRTKELGDIVSASDDPLSFVKKTLLHYYKIHSKWLTPIETKHCNLTARINILKTDLERLGD